MTNISEKFDPDRATPFGFAFDRVVFELATGRLLVDGEEVGAPALPLRLLQALCEHPGVLVTRKDLFNYIWPRQVATYEALTKVIGRLRELLGPYGARVVTVRNRGVRLDATVRRLQGAAPVEPVVNPDDVTAAAAVLHAAPIILIVDDSPDSITLLTEMLKDHYRTKIATNGASAIKAA